MKFGVMKLVVIESPYAGDVEANVVYARRAMKHSIGLGEAPIASHLLYPQVLNDNLPQDRELGIELGLNWLAMAHKQILYLDRGFSAGMQLALQEAYEWQIPIYARWIDGPVDLSILGEYEKYLDGCSGARRD